MPGEFDIDNRCNYGGDLSISMLEFIYNNFTDNDLRKYLIDHYLISYTEDNEHKITFNDINQIITRSNDNYIATLFGTTEGFEDYGFKYHLITNNSIINDQFKNDAANWDLATETSNLTDNAYYNKKTQFYDKAKYTLMTTRDKVKQDIKKQQEEAGLLAKQRLEAERKQQEIIREREKAVKNAELTESINKMNNALIDLLKK